MKKLLFGIIIITLPIIAYFQYVNYTRFNPPSEYGYTLSDQIDQNYHDQSMVDEYYQKAIEIRSFARGQWRTNGTDVLFPDQNDPEEMNASAYYNQLVSRVKRLETKLSASKAMKADGFSNQEIIEIENGKTKSTLVYGTEIAVLRSGDTGEQVWELQQQLIARGYDHRLDGVFGVGTRNALLAFQRDNDLYPSGQMSRSTFNILFKE